MPVMYKGTVDWTGFPGAPGFTNLYAITTDPLAEGADEFGLAIDAMVAHWANTLPTGVHVRVRQEFETINDVDGALEDVITVGSPYPDHNGALGGLYAGASGWCIDWLTSGAVFGRRRMGRSFVVPASTEIYQTDGTIASATLTEQRAAAAAYAAGGSWLPCVWVRPKTGAGAHAGQAVPITGARVPDLAAVLRSRRD